jgi:L-fuculose-phosphate aldolase
MTLEKNGLSARIDNPAVTAMRAKVARLAGLLFERHLTDSAGGNLTSRVGDVICMTPSLAGTTRQWQITGEDVLVIDLDGHILAGDGKLSRETFVHLKLHREFGEHGTGVIHAHARNALVFATMGVPIPPVLEATRKFGTVPVVPFAVSHSSRLADHVADAVRGNEARIRKQAMGVIAPYHGLFVMGKDIDATFDAVERIDTNAYILLMSKLLGGNDLMADQRAAMEAAIAASED